MKRIFSHLHSQFVVSSLPRLIYKVEFEDTDTLLENIDVSEDIKNVLRKKASHSDLETGTFNVLQEVESVFKNLRQEQIREARDLLRNDENTLDYFAAKEELFHPEKSSASPQELFQSEMRTFFTEKFHKEFPDDEWGLFVKEMFGEATEFYKKAKAEHPNHCSDEKSLEREQKELAILFKKSPDKDIKSFEEFLVYFKDQELVKQKFDSAKGARKEALEKMFTELAKKQFENLYGDASRVDKFDKDLIELTKNNTDLGKVFWAKWEEKGALSAKDMFLILADNANLLDEDFAQSLRQGNEKLLQKIENGSLKKLSEKFKKRTESLANREEKALRLLEEFPNSILRNNDFQDLSSKQISEQLDEYFSEKLDLNRIPKEVAVAFLSKLDIAKEQAIDGAQAKQVEVKDKQVEGLFDQLLSPDQLKGRTLNEVEKNATNELHKLTLFKNLPDKYRKQLDKKLKIRCKEFLKTAEKSVDKVSRKEISIAWNKYLKDLSSYKLDFKDQKDFRQQFVARYFPKQKSDAQKYFTDHAHFSEAFEKSFVNYEKGQEKKLQKDFNAVTALLLDSVIKAGMKKSFDGPQDATKKREWIQELHAKIPIYNKALKNLPTLETQLGNTKDKKILQEFTQLKQSYESNKRVYGDDFLAPNKYEDALQKLTNQLPAKESEIGNTIEQRHFAEKMNRMTIRHMDFRNPALLTPKNFYRALGWKEQVWIQPDKWEDYGADLFYEKADQLLEEFEVVASQTTKLEGEINSLTLDTLNTDTNYADINAFIRQPAMRQWFSNLGISNQAYDSLKDAVVKPHFTKLFAEYKQSKLDNPELESKSLKIKAAKDLFDSVTIEKTDLTRDFSTPEAFGDQKALHDDIKIEQELFDLPEVSGYFEVINIQLYAEHQKVRADMKRLDQALGHLRLDDLDPDRSFDSFEDFKRQPAMRQWFEAQGISNLAYDQLKDTKVAPKLKELWKQQQNPTEGVDEFSDEEMDEMGKKYDLNFRNLNLPNTRDIRKKFKRLDTVLHKSIGLQKLLRGRENNFMPFLLNFMGELYDKDFIRFQNQVDRERPTTKENFVAMLHQPEWSHWVQYTKDRRGDGWARLSSVDRGMKEASIQAILENPLEGEEGSLEERENVLENEPLPEIIEEDREEESPIEGNIEIRSEVELEESPDLAPEVLEIAPIELEDAELTDTETSEEIDLVEDDEILEKLPIEDDNNEELPEENISQIDDLDGFQSPDQEGGAVEEDIEDDEETKDSREDGSELEDKALVENAVPAEIIDDEEAQEEEDFVFEMNLGDDELEGDLVIPVSESGQEQSLTEDYQSFIDQNDQSATHFAEIYCPPGMLVKEFIHRVDMYVRLIGTHSLKTIIKLSEDILDKRIAEPKELFIELTDWLINQQIQTVTYTGSVNQDHLQLSVLGEKAFGIEQRELKSQLTT